MVILWDAAKERSLLRLRKISLPDVADLLMEGRYKAILANPARPAQMIFVLDYHGYTHVVPFILDGAGNIIVKTVYPSRKFHTLYGEENESTT